MKPENIKIALADQTRLCCEGIAKLIEEFSFVASVHECKDGKELLSVHREEVFDLVIIGSTLPDISSAQVTKMIKDNTPDTKVICLTGNLDPGMVIKMIEAGINGYLLKTCSQEELINAIKVVHTGNSYFSKGVNMKLLSDLMKNHAHRVSELSLPITDREFEILKYIADEMTNKEIAGELFISPRTVDTHRRNLLQKLHAKNTAGLVKYYLSVIGTGNVLV